MALTAKKVYAILKRQISDMEAKLNSPVRYRGTVATADLLPLNPDIGDMYNIESKSVYGEAGMNVAWNGVVWDTMGAPIDMSLYFTKEEAETVIQRLVTEYFEKNPVKPGATTEQAQQIKQNKTDIASLKTETNSLKEDISTKITKFYASSQGETHLADSDNGKIMDMMLYGRSEQKQYSGKNLLNYDAWKGLPITRGTAVFEKNSFTLTATENDCYTEPTPNVGFPDDAKIEISEGETVTLSWESSADIDGVIYIFPNGAIDGLVYANNHSAKTLTYTATRGVKFITFRFGVTSAGDTISYKNIQIEKGSEPTSYEPYTGGIPSPNPSYPQEIKSVVNPTVKVCGKNLLKTTLQTTTKNGVTCTNNGDGTYTLNGKLSSNTAFVLFSGSLSISNKSKIILMKNDAFADLGIAASYCAFKISSSWDDAINYPAIKEIPSGKIVRTISLVLRLSNSESPVTLTNVLIKPMIVDASLYPDTTYDDYEPYHEQTVTLPYDLYGVKVPSGGNVIINGQQYIADYVDVERGKRIRRIIKYKITGDESIYEHASGWIYCGTNLKMVAQICVTNIAKITTDAGILSGNYIRSGISGFYFTHNEVFTDINAFKNYVKNNDAYVYVVLQTPEEIDLTPEEIAAFKALATYYPTTNISVNSEQLDGYTVFNYPISMENGWNYVKKQLNDNRDYIYDMDARTQDIDTQAAEAYVNSEYAVALTELEV